MPNFAQRHGYEPMKMPFQREAVDNELRTKLWNVLSACIWDHWEPASEWRSQSDAARRIQDMTKRLWIHLFNRDLDTLPEFKSSYGKKGAYDVMKHFFFTCPWYNVYTFLEELAQDRSNLLRDEARQWIDAELERHNAAYRFVGTTITEITSEHEIAAIETAQEIAPDPVREHLRAALRMLSDREMPDYRNSIKESISAVESACRVATGMPKGTLSDALKRIPNLHPALALGFDKIYGYASDANGIRHSLTERPTNTYGEAKFMLVACSGFVSYLQIAAKQ
jgi:hypothetical protein